MNGIKKFSVSLADNIADFIGSWRFIIIQSTILIFWIIFNVDHLLNFDPYPFILLNLFLSFEAAYATPLILMSANRQAARDRVHLLKDLEINEEDHIIIKDLKKILDSLQDDMILSKKSLKSHKKLKSDHDELKAALNELKELILSR